MMRQTQNDHPKVAVCLARLVGKLAPLSLDQPPCGLGATEHAPGAVAAPDAFLRARPGFLGADLTAALSALHLRIHPRFPLSVELSEHTHSIAGVNHTEIPKSTEEGTTRG